jgi:hypothetical protein
MSVKQLAERLGMDVKDMDFELIGDCHNCKRMGGSHDIKCKTCEPWASVQKEEKSARS